MNHVTKSLKCCSEQKYLFSTFQSLSQQHGILSSLSQYKKLLLLPPPPTTTTMRHAPQNQIINRAMFNTNRIILSSRFITSSSTNNISSRNNKSVRTTRTKVKRGTRQLIRNSENANKNDQSISQLNNNDNSNVPNAFLILGVFPVIAMGGLLVVRDDLRQEFRQRWGS